MATATPYTPPGGFSQNAAFTISYRTSIAAPAEEVFRLLTTPSTWPTWNTGCTGHTLNDLSVGSVMGFKVRMNQAKPDSLSSTEITVQTMEKTADGYRVRWTAGPPLPKWLLFADRIQEIVQSPDDERACEYRTIEYMDGLFAYVVKYIWPSAAAVNTFVRTWANDLREYAEQLARQGRRVDA